MSEHTFVGNLTSDVELRYTQNGLAVANFTIAVNDKKFDRQKNEWIDGDTLYMPCSIWREQAEQVTQSLQKGMRVIATGKLKQRSFETQEGQKRTVVELDAFEVGPSLRYATAQVTRTQGKQAGQGGGFGQPQQGIAQQSFPQQGGFPNTPQQDVWGAPGTSYNDETPF